MEFFDKKEEVIDIELTQFGRHLLSKGRFNPKFYSFFDDNIIYNSDFVNLSELQNDSEDRIRDTPTMKPQVSISSLERKFTNQYEKVFVTGEVSSGDITFQNTPEKNYALPSPLGMSDINSEYSPSWTLRYLNGALTGTVENISLTEKTGGNNTVFIPQLESHVTVRVEALDAAANDLVADEVEDAPFLSEYEVLSEEDELFILLKVSENNGFFQKKNFDIEIFEIQEENQDGTIIETLTPLFFPKQNDPDTDLDFLNDVEPATDESYVDYYLDVLVDDEIDREIVCELDPDVDKTLGVFADPRTQECQDIINRRRRQVFNIYEDEADAGGEIC